MKGRWPKRLLIALGLLLVVLLALVLWLGGTGSGLRFALNRAVVVLDDKLSYGSAEGSLFGGLRLRDVRYYDPAIGEYQADLLEIAPRSRRLLTGELYLTELTLRDVRIVLPPPAPDEPAIDESFVLPAVIAPISMQIARLLVENVDVRDHQETSVLVLNRVEAAAGWHGAAFTIDHLDIDAPEGEISAQAVVDTGNDWAGEAGVDFRWQLPDRPQPLAGRLDLHGPQSRPALRLDLAEPSPALVDLSWSHDLGASHWQLNAQSEAFDLAALIPDPPVRTVAFDLSGTGTAETADIDGRIAIDGYVVVIEALSGSYRNSQLVVDAMTLTEANGSGRLTGSAHIDVSADTPAGDIDVQWQAINPPLDPPFDRLNANGTIKASGSLDHLVADIKAEATVDAQPVRLSAHAEGEPEGEIRFEPLLLATGDGRLEADGALRVEPALGWRAQVRARGFNPGLLASDWPGRVDLDAKTHGATADDILTAHVDIERIGGTLKQRPLGGGGHIEIAGGDRIDVDLDLRLGRNSLGVKGRLADEYDAHVRFDIDDFVLLLDGADGHATGEVTVRGRWPALDVTGHVSGSDIALNGVSVDTLRVDADLRTDFGRTGLLELDARNVLVAGERIERLWIKGRGDANANQLRLDADAEAGNAVVALTGRYDAASTTWSGSLDTFAVTSPELPAPLTLRESAALTVAADRIDIERTCLSAHAGSLCVDGTWRAGEGGDVGFELSRLPLSWLTVGGADTLAVDGELSGRGRFRLGTGSAVTGQAQIEGTPGRIRLSEVDEDDPARELVAWTRLHTTIELDGERRTVDAVVQLSPAGQIRAQVETQPRQGEAAALTGTIDLNLPDLSFIELLTPQIVQPVGELRGRLDLTGSTEVPNVNGDIGLSGFRAELPALGLQLRDSRVSLRATRGNRIEVDGRIATAENSALILGGWFGLPAEGRVPMDVRITGERVLVADIPAARVFVSPDLTVTATEERLEVSGEIVIPQARIFPERIEGGTTAASPDVHVVDPAAQAELAATEQAALPIHATVTVSLGDRVHIDGYGLEGRLSGQLEVRERPNRATTGRGEIVVTGTYQAYGQDLDIERGRLLFTGTPLDNPLLDIRATREVEAVTAGLAVTGSARQPVLEIYSVPAMDQAEALSYLVLGRPLRQATSAEDQSALGTAATAVSTAGGDLLAKSLGSRLGLDDVGVGTSRELGAGALTIGKYLSPRLYLGYGRSLFDGSQLVSLRYRLTEHFELEAQSGTRENKAGINYRYER